MGRGVSEVTEPLKGADQHGRQGGRGLSLGSMRRFAPLLLIPLLAACATRASATFSHGPVAEPVILHDKAVLEGLSGVDRVIIRHALDGTATLQIYAKEGHLDDAIGEAQSLGWTRVRN